MRSLCEDAGDPRQSNADNNDVALTELRAPAAAMISVGGLLAWFAQYPRIGSAFRSFMRRKPPAFSRYSQ